MLEALAIHKFQTGAVGTSQEAGKASEAPEQSASAQVRVADLLNQISQRAVAKDLPANAASLPAQAGRETATSAQAQSPGKSANQPGGTAGKLLSILSSRMEEPDGHAADAASLLGAGDQSLQIPDSMKSGLPVSSGRPADRVAKQDGPVQNALTAMEALQMNILARTETANTSPLPNGLPASLALNAHGIGVRNRGISAAVPHQQPPATALQNSTKDGGSPAAAGHNGSGEGPSGATASGSSGDAPKDGKTGQDSASRHSAVEGSQTSGGGAAAGDFNAVAASAGAQGSTAFAAANAPAPSTNYGQAKSGALPQPAAVTHTGIADKMTVVVENPLTPTAGEVNAASLLLRQGKSEMHVAMQTENLGPLELHAILDGGRLGASIAVVNHEAHTLLTNNLPALQQALNDQNLRVDHLTVLNTATSAGTHTGNGKGFQSGGHSQSQSHAPQWTFSQPAPLAAAGQEAAPVEILRGRLSVRA